MHTPDTERKGVGSAAKQVAERARHLVQLELELARLELKQKATSFGLGVALAIVGAVVAFFAVAFLLATLAAALATALSVWLSLLLVGVILLVIAAALVLIGLRKVRSAAPPVPEQAITEAKRTTEVLRSDGSRG